jgi:exosome complex exonuclease RRP6
MTDDIRRRHLITNTPIDVRPALRLGLPLPKLTAELFSSHRSSVNNEMATSEKISARPEHQYVKDRQKVAEMETFVVRELGGSQKRKGSNPDTCKRKTWDQGDAAVSFQNRETDSIEDTMMVIEDAAAREAAERKAARKLRRKQEKSQRKQDKAQSIKGENEADDDKPFNYTKATSLLHSQHNRGSQPGTQVFDPYKKSLNAPKGMRNAQREIEGKSFTFKN